MEREAAGMERTAESCSASDGEKRAVEAAAVLASSAARSRRERKRRSTMGGQYFTSMLFSSSIPVLKLRMESSRGKRW